MHTFWDTVVRPLLDLLDARTIVEIGVLRGETSQRILEYCRERGGVLHGIDPEPLLDERTWKTRWDGRLLLHRAKSVDEIPHLPPFDAVLIDGDHNWYTVTRELELLDRHAREHGTSPVLFLHDIDWPYGRRDMYCDLDAIPAESRQPHARRGMDMSVSALLPEGGLNRDALHAIGEGGARNGVLTAIEDFLRDRGNRWTLFEVHGFHGLGILVPRALLPRRPQLGEALQAMREPAFLERQNALLEQERIRVVVEGQDLLYRLLLLRQERAALCIEVGNVRREHAETLKECERLSGEKERLFQAIATFEREKRKMDEVLHQSLLEREMLSSNALLLYQTINRMERSRSWRWTAWLRALFRLLTTHNSSRTTTP